jgi:hypothetical protein
MGIHPHCSHADPALFPFLRKIHEIVVQTPGLCFKDGFRISY